MEVEHRLLSQQLENVTTRRINPWLEVCDGYLGEVSVTISKMGIGKVNAGAVTALLLNCASYDLVLNTGVAGGLDSCLGVGDIVVSDFVAYHDVDVRLFGYALGQVPGTDPLFSSPCVFIDDFLASHKNSGWKVVKGMILSGDQFISDKDCTDILRENFPLAKAVEMEGAAVAHISSLYQVPCIIIRAISDKADRTAKTSYTEFLQLASYRSAHLIRELIDVFKQKKN